MKRNNKQYIEFEEFKKILFEAKDKDAIVYWQGSVIWAITYKNINDTSEATKRGTVYFYSVIQKNSTETKSLNLVTDLLKKINTDFLKTRETINTLDIVAGAYRYKNKYSIYNKKLNFEITITNYNTRDTAISELEEKLHSQVYDAITKDIEKTKLFTQIFLNEDDRIKYNSSEEDIFNSVKKWIIQLVDHPEQFSGYNGDTIKNNILRLDKMKFLDFVNKSGAHSLIGAGLAKLLLKLGAWGINKWNGTGKDTSTPPAPGTPPSSPAPGSPPSSPSTPPSSPAPGTPPPPSRR